MPPTQAPHDPKKGGAQTPHRSRRPRGAFGLVAFAFLLLLLFVVLGDHFQPRQKLSQDDFWRNLYQGKIVTTRQRGPKSITGILKDPARDVPYEVAFSENYLSAEKIDQIGDLVNHTHLEPITEAALLARLEDRSFEAVELHHLIDRGKDAIYVSGYGEDSRNHWYEVRPSDTSRLQVTPLLRRVRETCPDATIHPPLRLGDGALAYEEPSTVLTQLLVNLVPWAVLVFLFYFFVLRQLRSPGGTGGVLSFGKIRANPATREKVNVTFGDVAGIEEAKEEVEEIVEFLKNPGKFSKLGARVPRGVLLVGAPGTGKTLLSKAIAGEADVPFFSISGSDFVEMFVGVGASRVRDLFRQAKESSPCIIFLDEIDAVGRRRGTGLGGGHDEREQTLNQILVEMDGFETDEGIILIAATNRPDVLDPALLRPGRFDRQIALDLPDFEGRAKILAVHAKKLKIAASVNLSVVARATPGFSGADLAALLNEAALIAVLHDRHEVTLADCEEARDKVKWGREKRHRRVEAEDRKITAYHEAGHTIIAFRLPEVEPLHKVTIMPRGPFLGATMQLPERDRYHMARKRILGDLTVMFGGRCAEEIACGDITAGAQNDIQRATDLVRTMVCEWGMSEKLGPITYADPQEHLFLGREITRTKQHSEKTAVEIDAEIRSILLDRYEKAKAMLLAEREQLDRLAEALLRYETLNAKEIEAVLAGADLDTLRPAEPKDGPGATAKPQSAEEARPDPLRRIAEKLTDLPGAEPQPGPSPA